MSIANAEYKNINELSFWTKNQQVREISEENWNKLIADIKRNSILEPFKIGTDNTVYDGNNRLKAARTIIAEGITQAENGKSLIEVPVIIYDPQTEASKWELALKGNEQFANWNQEGLANYMPEFENDLDLSLINIDFVEPESIDDQLEDESNISKSKNPKEYTCPNCQTKFTP